jgi:hypothetical protein
MNGRLVLSYSRSLQYWRENADDADLADFHGFFYLMHLNPNQVVELLHLFWRGLLLTLYIQRIAQCISYHHKGKHQ